MTSDKTFNTGTCLFDDRHADGSGARLFTAPTDVIEASHLAEVIPALERLSDAQAAGTFAAGYISYEAGFALEPRLAELSGRDTPPDLPLLRFWLYEGSTVLTRQEADAHIFGACGAGHRLGALRPALGKEQYIAEIERILELIRAGDIYQANYTFPLTGHLAGDPLSLFAALRAAQPVSYGVFLRMPEADIISLSPELFVRRQGEMLQTRPMKGTADRRASPKEDEEARRRLRADPKECAENLMIVDLLRNDLSRVCVPGSVKVPELFRVETYSTLHTMTSTVEGRMRRGQTTADILKAIFPCGSITGAPKIRAQEIIHERELGPRGPYTGAIGYFAPGGDFQLNVAIRTLVAERNGTVTYAVGSGIVADSEPRREYEECLLKARILTRESDPFSLIETLSWEHGKGFALLGRHLDRLAASAGFFGMAYDRGAVTAALDQAIAKAGGDRLRLRLTLSQEGEVEATATSLPEGAPSTLTFILGETAVDAADPYLRHKTTRRTFYESELTRAKQAYGAEEIVFQNQYGALTEGTWTNLFVERGGKLLTPPVECGLLPGTLRAELLDTGGAEEAVLTPADLGAADAVYLGNSVRGLMRARLVGRQHQSRQPVEAAE